MSLTNYAKEHFAKSRMYSNKYLNLNSGVYFSDKQVYEMIAFELNRSNEATDPGEQALVVSFSFDSIEEINKEQAASLNSLKRKWMFFEEYFETRQSEKVKAFMLYNEFVDAFGLTSHKQFYADLLCWTKENQYSVNFVNRLAMRKIILIKS